MTKVVLRDVSVEIHGVSLVDNASLSLKPGELVAVLGPNGAGKTSLLRALLGLISPCNGTVRIDGVDSRQLSPTERAQKLSYLPQRRPLAWPLTVHDMICLGRFSHGAALGRLSPQDAAAVEQSIAACDLAGLAARRTDTLSGGELARVHFARALAAKAPLLVADEPLAALDPRHQCRIAKLLRNFVDTGGGALVVLHEIELAAQIADRLVWMKDGKIVADDSPENTLTVDSMQQVFAVRSRVRRDDSGFNVRITGASSQGDDCKDRAAHHTANVESHID